MSKDLTYHHSTEINAPIHKVWDALINPEMTKQYMFGCEVVSDWKVGSKVIWRGASDGTVYVVGNVVKFEPNSVLAMTSFDPNGDYEDIPENYLIAEYVLTHENGVTTLNISQSGFATVENGQKRHEEAAGAWGMTMDLLKKLLEST